MAVLSQNRREKILWVLTFIVVFLWGWSQFVLRPVLDYGQKLDAELAVKKVKLREAYKILKTSPEQLTAKETLKSFFSAGSAQEDMAKIINDIEAAVTSSGLKVLETKRQPQINNVGWFELRVSISFEGQWPDIVQFFYEIENAPQPLLINEMSLETNVPQQTTVRGRLEIGRLLSARATE